MAQAAFAAEAGRLEKRYGMRLPGVSDRLSERFIKPLALDRILGGEGTDSLTGRIHLDPSGPVRNNTGIELFDRVVLV